MASKGGQRAMFFSDATLVENFKGNNCY